jgi:2-polyprenyl-3-methyl-5-hydroxy-6-metoxy-1,4-benzoquinol methylase
MFMYEHEYEAMYGLENSYWWFVARRTLAQELLSEEINGRPDVRILDVGCGTGANMNAFSRLGTTIGLDASAEALGFCKTRGLQSLVRSGVEDLPFASEVFDIVTALDVLEHIDDDLHGLREIHRICRHEGLLLVTVPAYGFLWSEHDEALRHRRRYTAHELRNKLTLTGFDVVRTSYFITSLFFPIMALRIWQGIVKHSTHPKTSHYIPPRWVNAFLIGLLGLERRVFRRVNLPFGVSIVALARPHTPVR